MNYKYLTTAALDSLFSAYGNDDFIFLETSKCDKANHRSLLFSKPIEHLVCRNNDDPAIFLKEAQEKLDQGYYLAGWLAYEFGYLLEPGLHLNKMQANNIIADLGVFGHPVVFNHQDGSVENGQWPQDETAKTLAINAPVTNIKTSQTESKYLDNIDKIREYIAAGDTYQVNYTLKLLFDLCVSPEDLYQILRNRQSVAYGAYIKFKNRHTLSFSPELFFHKKKNRCTVRPMKGTITRGRTLTEDQRQKNHLHHDLKNRSENIMIVDLLRNDLGRLASMGSVNVDSIFDIETYETLHQMTSTIRADIPEKLALIDLFKALFPCGSVTGAPKVRTMEIISELENEPRGIYTGAIGFLSPYNEVQFNVPIRTITIKNGKGEMGIGSGIVYDSDPKQEWHECLLKANFLTNEQRPDFSLIETILWQPDEGYWLYDQHIERLLSSALFFNYPVINDDIQTKLNEQAKSLDPLQCHRIRLLLDQYGKITTTATTCPKPNMAKLDINERPQKIKLAEKKTKSTDLFLYHKTTNRNLYNNQYQKAVDQGFYEVIFKNEKDQITEGAITNIFIRRGHLLLTPPIKCGLLPGTCRQEIINSPPKGFKVKEEAITEQDIRSADGVYLANSVRGLVRVELIH